MHGRHPNSFKAHCKPSSGTCYEKAKGNVILLIDGFAGHKLLSVDCQYIDVVEGIKAYRWEFVQVIWFLLNATSYI